MQKFNPIGKKYNDVITYFELNDFSYMRMVSDLGHNFLVSSDENSDLKSYYFNDENICYRFQWMFFAQNNKDSAIKWMNNNFEKIPDDSMQWIDSKQNLTYFVTDADGIVSLWCNSDKYELFNEQDDRIRVDYSIISGYDSEEDEWYEIERGEWSDFDEIVGEMFEHKFTMNRFVIPKDVKGKIEHFRTQGKMLTYEIVDILKEDADSITLGVIDEDDDRIILVLDKDLSFVIIVCKDGQMIAFGNE